MAEENYFRRLIREASTFCYINSATREEVEAAISWGAVGITMNPTHPPKALKANRDLWQPVIDKTIQDDPRLSDEDVADVVTQKMAKRSSDLFLSLFSQTEGRLGYCGIQGNPYRNDDFSDLVSQATRYSQIAPNVIPKIPSTEVGIQAVEVLTTMGIHTICTMGFSVAQNVAMAQAYERGLEGFRGKGQSPRCFVVIIPGILDEYLSGQVQLLNLFDVKPEVLRYAGAAIVRRSYRLFKERGFRANLMVAGTRQTYHFTDVVGEGIHITHNFDTWAKLREENPPIVQRIAEDVSSGILSELKDKFEDFRRAYEPAALEPGQFRSFGPCIRVNNFCRQGFTQFTNEIRARREVLAAVTK
jgi:transaldolase